MSSAAYELNGASVSQKRFYEIACDPRRSVAVEACAGAGKTWMLVSRMVRALLDGCAPHEILAITFTKKAAGEMRQRLHDWLSEFSRADDQVLAQELMQRGFVQAPTREQLDALRHLQRTLLESGRPVQVRTFHSWFAALLRSAPVGVLQDLGLPASYELLENDAKAVAQVWRVFLDRVCDDPLLLADYRASVAAHGRHQTHKALAAALAKRVEFAMADAAGVVDAGVQTFGQQYPSFASLAEPLGRLQEASVRADLLACAKALGASTLKTCIAAAQALEAALGANDFAGVSDALLTKAGTPRKFSENLAGLELVRRAQDLIEEINLAVAQHAAWAHQQRMARLTRGLVSDYAQLKRERGWVDMGDLERCALVLMRDTVLSGWVQERLDAKVRHLLIDEFQDTNPLQWQALSSWLQAYGGAAVAPSVFIVGDPKQSIYRFRRAEPQVFRAAKRFVVDGLQGDVLSCDHTRRNAPQVIELVNQVMLEAQQQGDFVDFRPHSTESTALGGIVKLPRIDRAAVARASVQHSQWRDSLQTPRVIAEETGKTLECRQAAHWLRQLLVDPELGCKPRDILVLARKRERLGLMQAELAALGIAAMQPEKNDLADMPEVQDVIALLDALVSPRHNLSLAQALKSPIFGLDDSLLVEIAQRVRALQAQRAMAGQDTQGVYWMQILLESGELPVALQEVSAKLQRWKQWVASLPPHDALHAIYSEGDVLARYAAAVPAQRCEAVLANLQATLMAALELDGGRYASPYALVRSLRAGGVKAPVRADPQAVRLLTIHGAKGLEAQWVLMLDTDGEAKKSETMGVLVDWPGEAAHPLQFVFLASESRPPACVAASLAREQQERTREELNALYVAMTRARGTLVVSSLEPHIKSANSWWDRLQGHAQEALGAGSGGAAEPVAGAVQHVAPQLHARQMMVLPTYKGKVHPALVGKAPSAIDLIANVVQPPMLVQGEKGADDTPEVRIGKAMHRLLEVLQAEIGGVQQSPWSVEHRASIAQQFMLDDAQAQLAHDMAMGIIGGQAAWVWNSDVIAWQGNELGLTHRGRVLRLDRLVRRQDSAEWWVLDYKSNATPQDDAMLLTQLATYRQCVAHIYKGQTVRAAFLTPQGRLIELPQT